MGTPSNVFLSYESKGNREGLSNLISRIDPVDTPYLSNAGKTDTDTIFTEWQNQALAAPDHTNAVLEGADAAFVAATATTRIGNYHQISTKTASVSRTQNRIKKAGRGNEMDYQVILKGLELKRDMETIVTYNQAAVAGADATIRKLGAIQAFLKTNVNKASDGSNPSWTTYPNATRTTGTARAFSLIIAKDVVSQMYTSGAKVEGAMILVGASNKQLFSTFAGIATQTYYITKVQKSALIGGLDVWVSDFGTTEVAPDRFMDASTALFCDFSKVKIGYLEPMLTFELAKTGDSEQKQIVVEWTLIVDNEKSQGIAADLL